jgi:hypothetical protein
MPDDEIIKHGRDEKVDIVRPIVLEDVSAAHDAYQIIVSTSGNPISAKRVSAETRALQCTGQMSEATIQKLSQNLGGSLQKAGEPQGQEATSFEATYGLGKVLPK